jgi:hypothetical protein
MSWMPSTGSPTRHEPRTRRRRHRRSQPGRLTLRHLLALPERPPVVADNASTDGTRDLLARDFPQVRLLSLPFNRGRRPHPRRARSQHSVRGVQRRRLLVGARRPVRARRPAARHPALRAVTARIVVEPDRTEDPIVTELCN